jgi:glycosyltransferase involved in cell wall biosynthesis
MRILFNTYPWAFATPGGGEMQLLKYAEHLPRQGIDVILYDAWNPAFDNIDVVHFFSCIGGSVHFCNYVRSRGSPLVINSSLWVTPDTTFLYPIDEIRAQLALADVIVPNSTSEADMLSRVLALPREKFMPVMNGFDAHFAGQHDPQLFRSQFGIAGPFVLNVANVEPRKNQRNLVRAMRHHEFPLVIIGQIRDADYGKQVLAEGGERLRYLGPLKYNDPVRSSAYAASSAFVLPSTLETPGLSALEAAAAGIPLVITSEGSTRDYFNSFAHYVDHSDPDDIRRGIDAALSAGPDPRLKAHVCTNFTWPVVTIPLLEVYREAIMRHSRRGG